MPSPPSWPSQKKTNLLKLICPAVLSVDWEPGTPPGGEADIWGPCSGSAVGEVKSTSILAKAPARSVLLVPVVVVVVVLLGAC